MTMEECFSRYDPNSHDYEITAHHSQDLAVEGKVLISVTKPSTLRITISEAGRDDTLIAVRENQDLLTVLLDLYGRRNDSIIFLYYLSREFGFEPASLTYKCVKHGHRLYKVYTTDSKACTCVGDLWLTPNRIKSCMSSVHQATADLLLIMFEPRNKFLEIFRSGVFYLASALMRVVAHLRTGIWKKTARPSITQLCNSTVGSWQ